MSYIILAIILSVLLCAVVLHIMHDLVTTLRELKRMNNNG